MTSKKFILIPFLGLFLACAGELRELDPQKQQQSHFESGDTEKVSKDEISTGESHRNLKEERVGDHSPLSNQRKSLPRHRVNLDILNKGENIVYFSRVDEELNYSESTPFQVGYTLIELNATLQKLNLQQRITGRENSICNEENYCLDWSWFSERQNKYVFIPKEFIKYKWKNKKETSISGVIQKVEKLSGDEYKLGLSIIGMGVLTDGQLICSVKSEEGNRCPEAMEVGDEIGLVYKGIAPPRDDATAHLFAIYK